MVLSLRFLVIVFVAVINRILDFWILGLQAIVFRRVVKVPLFMLVFFGLQHRLLGSSALVLLVWGLLGEFAQVEGHLLFLFCISPAGIRDSLQCTANGEAEKQAVEAGNDDLSNQSRYI